MVVSRGMLSKCIRVLTRIHGADTQWSPETPRNWTWPSDSNALWSVIFLNELYLFAMYFATFLRLLLLRFEQSRTENASGSL